MDGLTAKQLIQIKNWMYRNARPLDLARWKFHFENGSKDEVINYLRAYQNEDGGFGNTLEADSWNPNSSPISTSTAIEILKEIEFDEGAHPIINGILRYLEKTEDFTGKYWLAIIPSNNDHPHAPWWTYEESAVASWGYNPTAKLAGFILYFANKNSGIYKKAEEIAKAAIDAYIYGVMPDGNAYRSAYREAEIGCFHFLLEYLEAAGSGEVFITHELKNAMKKQAYLFIERDTNKWKQYCCKPSNFVTSPDCIFYEGNEEITKLELDYLLRNRNQDGVWDIVWSWGAYEKEFSISENWWKANIVIGNMLLMKNFDRLQM